MTLRFPMNTPSKSRQKVFRGVSTGMLSEGSSNVSGSLKILRVDSNLTEFEAECTRNGFSHYPSHSMRLQIGNYYSLYPNAVI